MLLRRSVLLIAILTLSLVGAQDDLVIPATEKPEAEGNAFYINIFFVHPIFLSFGFWYFGQFSCMIFFPYFSHLALQNVDKDYIIFSYFRNFVSKSDQKPKMT